MMRYVIFFMMIFLSTQMRGQNTIVKREQGGKVMVPHNTSKKQKIHTATLNETDRKQVLQRIIDNMVYIEGGTYLMGSKYKSHRPKVTVSSFYLGKYEVTQEEWVAVMGQNPSRFKGAKLPVENISWEQAEQFVEKLNLLTKRKFRLPTAAEWEYAARGGKFDKENEYSGSNDVSLVAWSSADIDFQHPGKMHNVGMKQPNELGIYDMSGNVWEWCNDFYKVGLDYEVATNPCNLQKGTKGHVIRGGDFSNLPIFCTTSEETYFGAIMPSYVGLRLAHDISFGDDNK